jgi:hypothetical protein
MEKKSDVSIILHTIIKNRAERRKEAYEALFFG